MDIKPAICTTVADAENHIEFFIQYHLSIGFENIFVFIDDCNEKTFKIASSFPNVIPILNDLSLQELWKFTPHYKDITKRVIISSEVMVRQELNLHVALSLAVDLKIDWLLHIDLDELFYLNNHSLKSHLKYCKSNSYGSAVYVNYEAIAVKEESSQIYTATTYFKKNFFRRGAWTYSTEQKSFLNETEWLTEKYLNFYQNGKCGVFLNQDLVIKDVHMIIAKDSKNKLMTHKDPLILHFPCVTFKEYLKKYKRLGDFTDYWNGQPRAGKFIDTFHLESRDIVGRKKEEEVRRFYTEKMLFDSYQIRQLKEVGLLKELDAITQCYFKDVDIRDDLDVVQNGIPLDAIEGPLRDDESTHFDLESLSVIDTELEKIEFENIRDARRWFRSHPVFKHDKSYSLVEFGQKVTLCLDGRPCIDFGSEENQEKIKKFVSGKRFVLTDLRTLTAKIASVNSFREHRLDQYRIFSRLAENSESFIQVEPEFELFLIPLVRDRQSPKLIEKELLDVFLDSVKERKKETLSLYIAKNYPKTPIVIWGHYLNRKYLDSRSREKGVVLKSNDLSFYSVLLFSLGGVINYDPDWGSDPEFLLEKIMHLRDEYAIIKDVYASQILAEHEDLIILIKKSTNAKFIALLNFSDKLTCISGLQIKMYDLGGFWRDLFNGQEVNLSETTRIDIPAYSYLWFYKT